MARCRRIIPGWVAASALWIAPACDGSDAPARLADAATPDDAATALDAPPPDAAGESDAARLPTPPDAAPRPPDAAAAARLDAVEPEVVDPLGGSTLRLTGAGFGDGARVRAVRIGGVRARSFEVASDQALVVVTEAMAPGEGLDVEVEVGEAVLRLTGALTAWSPAEIAGSRLFDAATGVEVEEPTTTYEWQRLTASIGDEWRVRDGNTLTWLPSTQRYWMVAGWNGYQAPDGFSPVPPDDVYPPLNTTDEVWSSADGASWRLERAHGTAGFERRHSHNTVLWRDALWMIGGDTHQGRYNHDVVTSADGVNWRVVLGPGTTPPPWTPRALQAIGVHDGDLWMAGGQDLLGPIEEYTYHNDVWRSADGENWTQVVPDAPASPTRWGGCGVLDGLVSFRGELWLVGCARERENAEGHLMFNAVWSSRDGVEWRPHATPPWAGKIWPNVVVWDDKLWILFGYTLGDQANGFPAGNANEVWFSEDGESWQSLPADSPVPGSHAQGVAVTESQLVLAGGNYGFGFGAGVDKSTWRLVPFRGRSVRGWRARGDDALWVEAPENEARPVQVDDAFGSGSPGLQFDGSRHVLSLPEGVADTQPSGRSVFWVARAPYLPLPWGWTEDYAPVETVVGGSAVVGGVPETGVGLSGGQLVVVNREAGLGPVGEPLYVRRAAGEDLQPGAGEVRLMGVTHGADGTLRFFVDGASVGPPQAAEYGAGRAWSMLGGGMHGPYYGPNSRFAGTIGAVWVAPGVVEPATLSRLAAWARGRFGTPR
ncbi:MAG: IPT/TIG domain-containing protein [Bradymonadia bacterium]|jgi:hypothetical protein